MKPDVLLSELERVAAGMGLKVSYEAIGAAIGHGGLCRVKNEYRVIIDKRAGSSERAATIAEALAAFDWKSVEMPAKARELVAYYAVRRAS